MSDVTVGKLISEYAHRDAIHVAIAPLEALEPLQPGEHVGLSADGKADSTAKHIGIVDPFLTKAVKRGERFYMFLYPKTVTGLRHDWTHPAFTSAVQFNGISVEQRAEPEAWLRTFADRNEGDYDDMITAAAKGETYCFGTDIEYGDFDSEFWGHVENVTGKRFTQNHRENTGFRCAC